jgi:hypothetical protein
MTTKIYKQKKFWFAVIVIALVAVGLAAYFLTKQAGVSLNPVASQNQQKGNNKLEIYTSPKGATITLDGKQQKEKSPAKISVNPGKHTVVLKLDGYDTATIPITVFSNQPNVIQQTFTKQGKITVSQKPAEWPTYSNEQFKYRIKHPDSWEVDSNQPQVVNFFNKNRAQGPEAFRLPGVETALAHGEDQTSLTILSQPNPSNLSPADWYKARPEYSQEDQSQIKTKELTIGGRPAFQFETPYGFLPYVNTVVTGNGYAYIMQQVKGSPERETYDQVVQTFTLF